MHCGIQQRNIFKKSVILNIFLENFYSNFKLVANFFAKWLQLLANKSYLLPKFKY